MLGDGRQVVGSSLQLAAWQLSSPPGPPTRAGGCTQMLILPLAVAVPFRIVGAPGRELQGQEEERECRCARAALAREPRGDLMCTAPLRADRL